MSATLSEMACEAEHCCAYVCCCCQQGGIDERGGTDAPPVAEQTDNTKLEGSKA